MDNQTTLELKKVGIFQRLSDEALAEVAGALTRRSYDTGEVLFNQGDAGNELMIVQSGRVAIYTPSEDEPGGEQPIRIFESTEAFGEMALIDQEPRSLSARALAPSRVWVLTGESFRSLIREAPDVALAVMAELNDRIRYTTQFLEEVRRWIKRIGEGSYEREFQPDTAYEDPSLRRLAAEFAQMAAQVQKRETELRKEVFRLQIQIDESKKERQVSEIVESDYFQSLREQAKKLRGD